MWTRRSIFRGLCILPWNPRMSKKKTHMSFIMMEMFAEQQRRKANHGKGWKMSLIDFDVHKSYDEDINIHLSYCSAWYRGRRLNLWAQFAGLESRHRVQTNGVWTKHLENCKLRTWLQIAYWCCKDCKKSPSSIRSFFPILKVINFMEKLISGWLGSHIEHVSPIVININIWTAPIARAFALEVENFLFHLFYSFFSSSKAHTSNYEAFYRVSIFIWKSDVLCILKHLRISAAAWQGEGRKLFLKN